MKYTMIFGIIGMLIACVVILIICFVFALTPVMSLFAGMICGAVFTNAGMFIGSNFDIRR